MTFFGIILFCSMVIYVQSQGFEKAKLPEISLQCVVESGASISDIDPMMKQKPASSASAKCLRACLFKKFRMMNNYGQMDLAVSLEIAEIFGAGNPLRTQLAIDMMAACTFIILPENHCEAAETYITCLRQQAQSIGSPTFFYIPWNEKVKQAKANK